MGELLDRFMQTVQLAQALKGLTQADTIWQQSQEDRQRQLERERRQMEMQDFGLRRGLQQEGGAPVTGTGSVYNAFTGGETMQTPVGQYSVPTYKERQRRELNQLQEVAKVKRGEAVQQATDTAEAQARVKDKYKPRVKVSADDAKMLGLPAGEVDKEDFDSALKLWQAKNPKQSISHTVDKNGNVHFFEGTKPAGVAVGAGKPATEPQAKTELSAQRMAQLRVKARRLFKEKHGAGVETQDYKDYIAADNDAEDAIRNKVKRYEKPEDTTEYNQILDDLISNERPAAATGRSGGKTPRFAKMIEAGKQKKPFPAARLAEFAKRNNITEDEARRRITSQGYVIQ